MSRKLLLQDARNNPVGAVIFCVSSLYSFRLRTLPNISSQIRLSVRAEMLKIGHENELLGSILYNLRLIPVCARTTGALQQLSI
jgi:hypothetical protein